MRAALALILLAGAATAQGTDARRAVPGGDAAAGAALMAGYGCGVCHTIPGLRGARGTVGPDLTGIAGRDFIAGSLPNRPGEMIRWLVDPAVFAPDSAMPDMGVTLAEARDIAAYLYTLDAGAPGPMRRNLNVWVGGLFGR